MPDLQVTPAVNSRDPFSGFTPPLPPGAKRQPNHVDSDGTIWPDPYVDTHDYTRGNFATEVDAVADFRRRISVAHELEVHYEVTGTLMQPRPGQKTTGVRIDAIIVPRDWALPGWKHGAIGVEIKRSKTKVGPPLAQMCDYTRSAFTLPNGATVIPSMVLLYPWHGPGGGPFLSMIVQNKLGWLCPTIDGGLTFSSGQVFATIDEWGTLELRNNVERQGNKVGSR